MSTDFGGVRIHTDGEAAALAESVQATAFTHGSDIYFGKGAYSPTTSRGQQLIAHELAHTVQHATPSGSSAGLTIGRAADPAEAQADRVADTVMRALQRTTGRAGWSEAEVPSAPRSIDTRPGNDIRRRITVRNIDFNPDPGAGKVHAEITDNDFYATLTGSFKKATLDQPFINQSGNVIKAIRSKSFKGQDVEQLTEQIADAMKAEYGAKGLTGWSSSDWSALVGLVRSAVLANLTPTKMDKQEQQAFDILVNIVGEENMSRRKGSPTEIPLASLPSYLATNVTGCHDDIHDERRMWKRTKWNFDTLTVAHVSGVTSARLKEQGRYQGNHTNNAGWLPTVPVGPSPIPAMRQAILNNASPALHAELTQPNPMQRLTANRSNRQEYEKLLAHELGAYDDLGLGDLALASMGFGVSAYIEFNLPHKISRLMYDFVNKKFYLTAHYKWKDGYNPFFEVTGMPPL